MVVCTKGRVLFTSTLDESLLQGNPHSWGTIAAPGPDGDQVSRITRPSQAGDHTDFINVVQPRTSKGITDLLLLLFLRLRAADPAKKKAAHAPTTETNHRQSCSRRTTEAAAKLRGSRGTFGFGANDNFVCAL